MTERSARVGIVILAFAAAILVAAFIMTVDFLLQRPGGVDLVGMLSALAIACPVTAVFALPVAVPLYFFFWFFGKVNLATILFGGVLTGLLVATFFQRAPGDDFPTSWLMLPAGGLSALAFWLVWQWRSQPGLHAGVK